MHEKENSASVFDLVSYFKAIPDDRMRRLLLLSVLAILISCHKLCELKCFARRHHRVLSEALLLETVAQIPSGAIGFDQLICDAKILRGSNEPTAGSGSGFIAQVTMYSAALGIFFNQACYATGESHERGVFK